MPDLKVPVVLFMFNRPHLAQRVIQAVAAARPAELFVITDGPRTLHPEDEPLIAESLAAIDQVDWPCEVAVHSSKENLGCDRRIASGLDWVFEQVDRAIILEDDCVPDQSFFPYCEQLLERYREQQRVHMISGFNASGLRTSFSYHFSRCYHIWGWATWARAWSHYDETMESWPQLRQDRWLKSLLGDEKGARLTDMFFQEAYSRRMPQWDFYWAFSSLRRDAFSITPEVNLVRNIGHGPEATHQRDPDDPFANLPQGSLSFPLRHPPELEVFAESDRVAWESAHDRVPQLEKRGWWRAFIPASRRPVGARPG